MTVKGRKITAEQIKVSLLVVILGAIVTVWVILETRVFSSAQMRYDTERVISTLGNISRLDSITHHIGDTELHKSFEVMNELWVPRTEIDSLVLENARYHNALTSQIDATNRMIQKTNVMMQNWIKNNK